MGDRLECAVDPTSRYQWLGLADPGERVTADVQDQAKNPQRNAVIDRDPVLQVVDEPDRGDEFSMTRSRHLAL
ncbi:MAG TPA: hypothetical protein VFJ82_13565 [Longimicrobium sp.]|nr:hypothetical protein [Longimicrobium sp.]